MVYYSVIISTDCEIIELVYTVQFVASNAMGNGNHRRSLYSKLYHIHCNHEQDLNQKAEH